MSIMTNVKGAIFDVDGTILDSMPIWDNVAAIYLESRGIAPRPGLRAALLPLGGNQIPEYFQREYGVTEPMQVIADAINAIVEEFYLNRATLKDGILQILTSLERRGIKMCVATATDRYLVEAALKRCGVLHYFGRVYTCSEEQTGKDRPDIFLTAAKFLGTEISETCVFEDALYAIKTAKAAGFPVVAVYDLSADGQQDEIRALADRYYKSFAEWSENDD